MLGQLGSRRGFIAWSTALLAVVIGRDAGEAQAAGKVARRLSGDRLLCPENECGYIYDPARGDPEGGVAPGIRFEDLPSDWVCPVCGRPHQRWL